METCNFCGGEKVLNPKTGKMFCKNKCWLNKPQGSQKPQGDNNQVERVLDGMFKIYERLGEILEVLKK